MIEDLGNIFAPTNESFKILKFAIEFYTNNIDLIKKLDENLEKHFEERGKVGEIEKNIIVSAKISLMEAGFDDKVINIIYSFAIVLSIAKLGICPLPIQDYSSATNIVKDFLEKICAEQQPEGYYNPLYKFNIFALLIQDSFKMTVSDILQNKEQFNQILLDQQTSESTRTVKVSNKFCPS